MNLLTVIVLIIFAIFILRGYRRGFVKSLASMMSIVLSVLLVNFAEPYVTDFLKEQTPVYDYVLKKCEATFAVPETDAGGSAQEGAREDSAQMQAELIDALPLPDLLKNLLQENNTPQFYQQLAVQNFSQYVPQYMANLILSSLSFVAAWILVASFIWLAIMTLDMIAGLPVIRGINQVLGLGLGFLQALALVWIAFLAITVCSHTEVGGQLMAMISESVLLEKLYDANLFLKFLTGFSRSFL